MANIGHILRRARLDHGWSEQEAAERLGVTRQAVNHWERDKRQPRGGALLRVCRTYGLSTDMIFDALMEEPDTVPGNTEKPPEGTEEPASKAS